MVVLMPFRRTVQTKDKGISVPKDNRKRDSLTGQVTGDSRAAKLTKTETTLLIELGDVIEELNVVRGGDLGASRAMNALLTKNGTASLKQVMDNASGVESTNTLKAFLKGAMIQLDT
jgi:hypothetical protein